MAFVQTKVTQKVVKNITRQVMGNFDSLAGTVTKVGFPQGGKLGSVIRKFRGPGPKTLEEVATYATRLEFGPVGAKRKKWPFLTISFHEGLTELQKISAAVVKKTADRRIGSMQALGMIGEVHKDQIVEEIKTILTPQLEDETIQIKKSSKPMIDTGVMLNSVSHKEVRR